MLVPQLYPTLCDPTESSLSSSSVHRNSPGKNTGVGCHFLLQRIFPTQGSNPGLLHCREILYWLSYQGSPMIMLALTNFVFFLRDNNGLEDLKKKKRSFPICRVFNSFIFSICQQIAICLTKDFFPTVNKHQISYQLFFPGVLSWSHLQVLLLLTHRSTPQLSSWNTLFLSVLYCLFYGTHVLLSCFIYSFC